jgi:cytochrome c553
MNNTKRFHDRQWPRYLLAAALGAGGSLALAGEVPSEAVLARDLAASCAACHGTEGRSVGGFAGLRGASRDAILEKLKGFRTGALQASVMHQHAKGYTDRELDLLADYFAKQPQPASQGEKP